ncbi:hypothetical protein BOX15_Mlig015826g4 [Macrostomum lignano]|uniref:Uncharacterized protein n=1 Tax=Macrostomum lignano TaxID=282301 RepID=A0A267FLV8_9PLAT|nr:hypothetical protein BOX15_Mlig015826g4 [Macrostomum lignano]
MLRLDALQKATNIYARYFQGSRLIICPGGSLKTVQLQFTCGLKSNSEIMDGDASPSASNCKTSTTAQAALPPEVQQAHKCAVDRGEDTYIDPATGYRVFTELAHKKRGHCCGHLCRHCPYNHEAVKKS